MNGPQETLQEDLSIPNINLTRRSGKEVQKTLEIMDELKNYLKKP